VRVYLSASTIYRNAASYLAEWIELHRVVGVERFFLYDNGSSDAHRDVLAPYLGDGTVVLHEWPMPFLGVSGRGMAQLRAFDHALRAHRDDSRWIAFLDIDEFLFSPTRNPVSDLLPEYEPYPALCVSRAEYGSSGHRTRPEGLVIENFTRRGSVPADGWVRVKSVVDPSRAVRAISSHTFLYRDGDPVDENLRRVDQFDRSGMKPVAWSRFRINHYPTKSEEEFDRKNELWRDVGPLRTAPVPRGTTAIRGGLGVEDDVLASYGSAVRQALARRSPVAHPER
jgi:hypothetical protein